MAASAASTTCEKENYVDNVSNVGGRGRASKREREREGVQQFSSSFPHTCSVGVRSGDPEGHSERFISFILLKPTGNPLWQHTRFLFFFYFHVGTVLSDSLMKSELRCRAL